MQEVYRRILAIPVKEYTGHGGVAGKEAKHWALYLLSLGRFCSGC